MRHVKIATGGIDNFDFGDGAMGSTSEDSRDSSKGRLHKHLSSLGIICNMSNYKYIWLKHFSFCKSVTQIFMWMILNRHRGKNK